MRKTIWIIVLFLIFPNVYSYAAYINYSCGMIPNPEPLNLTGIGNLSKYTKKLGATVNVSNTEMNASSGDSSYLSTGIIADTATGFPSLTNGMALEFNLSLSSSSAGQDWGAGFVTFFHTAGAGTCNSANCVISDTAATGVRTFTNPTGGSAIGYDYFDGTELNMIIFMNTTGASNGVTCVRDKNTLVSNWTCGAGPDGITLNAKLNASFAIRTAGRTLRVHDVHAWNASLGCPTGTVSFAGPDTEPPNITYYNLTNENGCENWNTDKNNACITSSVTPTVQFNTSEYAWCAIAGSGSSTSLDLNYTDMGNSRNCTGSAAGEGGRVHFCTLTLQDELVSDVSYLFISCKDTSNNQNRTSTSGALALNITGLEDTARNSIELAIRNSLLSGYSIYTDQKIYARNSANSQAVGTFDKAVKKLNKIWAFNRIGISDSFVNMFNITPILYTLEFENTTSARITNLTELMINATK